MLVIVSLASWSAQALPLQTLDSASTQDNLMRGFENPPNGARPRVWWHWMNGNIAPEGIKLDLEWMHSIGLEESQSLKALSQLRKWCRIGLST